MRVCPGTSTCHNLLVNVSHIPFATRSWNHDASPTDDASRSGSALPPPKKCWKNCACTLTAARTAVAISRRMSVTPQRVGSDGMITPRTHALAFKFAQITLSHVLLCCLRVSMSILTGEHCALSSCGALSFLPLRCACCTKLFCEVHSKPECHFCSAEKTSASREPAVPAASRTVCAYAGCKRPTLHVPNAQVAHAAPTCYKCQGLFCMAHRPPRSHGCTAATPPTPGQLRAATAEARRNAARAALARNFPQYNRKSTS